MTVLLKSICALRRVLPSPGFRISEDEIIARKEKLEEEIEELKNSGANNDTLLNKQLELQSIEQQHNSIVEAIRTVLERRIDSLGVSEATITPSYVGNEKHLLVECPGVIDVQECITTVGKTIQLEFKEEYSGPSEEYETEMRSKADEVYASITNGEGTIQKWGQDLSSNLGVSYAEAQPYFESALPEELRPLWDGTPGDAPLRAEGSISVVRQNADGSPSIVDMRGIYISEVVTARQPTTHVLTDPSDALQELANTVPEATYTRHDAQPISSAPPALQPTLDTADIGQKTVVATGDNTAAIAYVQGRVPGETEMEVSHILVQYAGAQRADEGVTRTKEEARARAEELTRQLNGGADFATLARNESDGPSKGQAGSLGTIAPGVMVAPFEQVAFSLTQPGQVSDVVETVFGFHIIRADSLPRNTPTTVTYDLLSVRGENAEQTATELNDRIDNGGVSRTEDEIVLNTLFFSMEPTGWKDTALNGQHFRNASASSDPVTGVPVVQIQFDEEGGTLFYELTKANIGKRIAIFVGGELVSAPVVNTEISGGTAIITGSRTFDEARLLAQDLNTGAIPAPIYLSGQNTIEATLGATALRQSVFAGLIGLLILAVFMVIIYRGLGVMANIALVFYVVLMIALLKLPLLLFTSQQIVLTLAGIAGIILSIGMAVDANVLAFERIKEEVRKGKLLKTAVETGFSRAWPSVRDGNVSTLITCAILFLVGTSIIRGFSITLTTGILASMYTSIVVTRWLTRKLITSPLAERTELLGLKRK